MSMYTTGEIAKLCGVSVRTVQYYDTRKILIPSELSEGGRRLYSEDDLRKMRVICFLREAGLSINSISQLLEESDPGSVIALLIDEREKELQEEKKDCETKLSILSGMRRSLKEIEDFSVDSIADIANVMKNKAELHRTRRNMLFSAVPMGIIEWASILLWIFSGIWRPFAFYTLLAVPYTLWIINYYWRKISYICPQCHRVFKPGKLEFTFAPHSMTTRRLTCSCCGHKGFCVETSAKEA